MRGRAGLLLLALAIGPAVPAGAEIRRLEVVGAVPADPDRAPEAPRAQAALADALDEAVERVAQGLLVGPDGSVPDFDREAVLGDEATDYAVRFRILEDRGERRALLITDPSVAREYVVLVEVHVDVARVRTRLTEAGLLLGGGDAGPRSFRLELLELQSARAYSEVRRALLDQAGAEQVVPLLFERGRAVLQVRSGAGRSAVLDRLLRVELAPGLSLDRLPPSEDGVRLRVRETPPDGALDELPPAAASAPPAP